MFGHQRFKGKIMKTKILDFLKLGYSPVKQFVTGTVWPFIRMRKVYSFIVAVIASPIWLNPFVWAVLTPVAIAVLVYLSFKVLHSDKNPCEMERAFKPKHGRSRRPADDDYYDSEE